MPSNNDDWLKDKLSSIESKVDKLDVRLDGVDITLVKQSVELESHIRRTTLAEENIQLLRSDFKPIQKHVDAVHTILKIIGLIATIVAMGSGVIHILQWFNVSP